MAAKSLEYDCPICAVHAGNPCQNTGRSKRPGSVAQAPHKYRRNRARAHFALCGWPAQIAGNPDWCDRYQFVSVRGRIWTRAMVRRASMRFARSLGLGIADEFVDRVLDDDAFMHRRRGEVPARVVEAVYIEAFRRAQVASR